MANKLKSPISAIIIAKNEEAMIEDCLMSLSFVSEIILVDTGSTDKTSNIAAKYNAKIIKSDKKSFSDWRNEGLKKALQPWVLYIDCDERVSAKLASEISDIVSSKPDKWGCFAIPRRNEIFGKKFSYGGWYPDYVKRLFPKAYLSKWVGDLHEEPVFKGEIFHLKNDLQHIKHEDVFEMLEKTNKWSDIEASLMFASGHPPMNIPRFLSAMGREFIRRMIMQKAFLDGGEGIIMAIYQTYSRFLSYAKLWELQEKDKITKK